MILNVLGPAWNLLGRHLLPNSPNASSGRFLEWCFRKGWHFWSQWDSKLPSKRLTIVPDCPVIYFNVQIPLIRLHSIFRLWLASMFPIKIAGNERQMKRKMPPLCPPKMKNAPPQTSIIAVRSAYVPSCNATWNTNPDRRTPSFSAVNARQKHMAFAQSEPKQKESAGLLL